ncbi:MAG: DUF4384 domain-containing protein [Calditrichaeota bacterium]|nr:DUF4384 domain-containing protein [Calditrichota bacterium]
MTRFSIILILITSVFSQEEKLVIKEAEYSSADVSATVGFQRAEEVAMKEAIEEAAGIQVNTSKFFTQSSVNENVVKTFSNFTNVYSNATIKAKKTLDRQIKSIESGDQIIPTYWVKMEITLVIDKNGIDPLFQLKVDMNKPVFVAGESLQLSVESNKECYITILNITDGNQVSVLYPNSVMKKNHLTAGEKIEIPPAQYAGAFEATTGGKVSTSEIVMVIATKEEVKMLTDGVDPESGLEKVSLANFQKWISAIPLNQRTIESKIYSIFQRKN